LILEGDFVKTGCPNPESKRYSRQGDKRGHATGGDAHATVVGPRKRGKSRIFAAVLARLRQYFGPGIISQAPFLLVPINCPVVFYRGGIQRGEFLK